jgi:hypothetical protein
VLVIGELLAVLPVGLYTSRFVFLNIEPDSM